MKSSHLQLKSPLSGQEAEKVAFKEAAYRRLHLVVDLVRMLSGLHLQTKVVHLDLKKENISSTSLYNLLGLSSPSLRNNGTRLCSRT